MLIKRVISLAFLSGLFLGLAPLDFVVSEAKAESLSVTNGSKGASTVPVSQSSQIVILPMLIVGRQCTFSVVDGNGRPLSNAGVNLGEQLFVTDSMGTVTFNVPDQDAFELTLQGDGRKKIGKRKFKRVTDKVLAESDSLAEAASSILNLDSTTSGAPAVLYSPSVISPGEVFVVLGKNFSEKISDNVIDIDGLNATVLSASKDGLLALAPVRLRMGPQKEIFVTVNNQASNICELDVATPFFNHSKTDDNDASPEHGKLGMNGTNVPCLLRVVNEDTDAVTLWSPKQEPMGKTNILLTPGGDQNFLDIDMRVLARSKKENPVSLSLEQAMGSLNGSGTIPPQLLSAICKAEIIRLERRKVATEYRLDALRKMSGPELSGQTIDADKMETESKALSLRLQRIRKSLSARQAIFESLGYTDAQYRQVLDDATGGALLTLDQSVKPIVIVSDGGVAYASSDSDNKPAPKTKKKAISQRMMEPVIRLLPPMTKEEQAIFDAMQSKTPTGNLGDSTTSGRSGGDNVVTNAEGVQLRGQNFVEPEPGFSEESRAGLGKPGDSVKSLKSSAGSKPAASVNSKPAPVHSKPAAEKTNLVKDSNAKSLAVKKSKRGKPAISSKTAKRSTSSVVLKKRRRRR